MATIETIGSTGCDYTTIQAWYDAHKGNITSDPNAPYIGELATEIHLLTAPLEFIDSVTSATKYFHLRPRDDWFSGIKNDQYPILQFTSFTSHVVRILDCNYLKLEGFSIQDCSSVVTSDNKYPYLIQNEYGDVVFLNRMLISDILVGGVDTYNGFKSNWKPRLIVFGLFTGGTFVISNCVLNNIMARIDDYYDPSESIGAHLCIFGRHFTGTNPATTYYVYCRNTTMRNIKATSLVTHPTLPTKVYVAQAELISLYDAEFNIYNCVYCDDAVDGLAKAYACISNDTINTYYWSHVISSDLDPVPTYDKNYTTAISYHTKEVTASEVMVDPLNGDFRTKEGSVADGSGLNLYDAGASYLFTNDIEGNPYPTTGAWPIGCSLPVAASSSPSRSILTNLHKGPGVFNSSEQLDAPAVFGGT